MTTPTDDIDSLMRRLGDLEATVARVANDLADLAVAVVPDTDRVEGMDEVPQLAYRSLDAWVNDYFTVVFARAVGGEMRWCSQWRDHREALTRLEALWRSWETL